MNENLIKKCRFCLYEEKSDDMNQVLGIFQGELPEDLPEKIINYTQIQVSPDDNIPPNICVECIGSIVKFEKFLDCCWESDKALKDIYMIKDTNRNVKSEKSKTHLSNEHNLEPTSNNIEKLETSDNDNETSYSKTEDIATDDLIEVSDSDVSSIKERTVAKVRHTKTIRVNKSMRIIGDHTYVCSICSKEFKSFFDYQDHQDTHNGQLVFSCTKCDQIFSERSQLLEHDANHKVPCQVCNKMVLPKSLPAHLKKHTDLFRCGECNLSHTSKAALEKHERARHRGQKGLVCHVCGKQNSCQSSLNRHLAYHSSARPYRCDQCNFSTKSRGILKVHASRKHLGEQKTCGQCGKAFKSDVSLKQHITRIHAPRKYVCRVCQKAFPEKHSLERHLAKHAKQRLYECEVCKAEFQTVRQLKEHMLSHKEGCVSCPKCGKRFFYKKYLEKHMIKCVPDSEGETFKEQLWRLKSTISLPSSSVFAEKLKSYQ